MINATNNTTTALSSPFVGDSINHVARAIFATMGSIMIVCGVLGNLLLLTVIFTRFQRNRYVHNLFIANLALADILTLGYWLTFLVLDLILGYYPVVNQAHCVVNGMVICTLSTVCVLSLLSISLNRYLHVCYSHLYSRIFTPPRTVVFTLSIWVLGILVALPPVLGIGAGSYHYSTVTHICSFNRQNLSYAKITVVLFSTAPMIFIGYWNFAIFRFWKKAKTNLKHWYTPVEKKQRRRGKFLTAWKERLKKSGELDRSAGQENTDGAEGPHGGEDRGDHVTEVSMEESASIGLSTARNMDASEFHDSHIDSSAYDTGEPEDDDGSPTKINNFSDKTPKRNKAECSKTTSSSSDARFNLQKRTEDKEVRDFNQGTHDHNQAKQILKEEPISKAKIAGESSLTVASIQTLAVAGRAPSNSPAPSPRLARSSSNRQKHHITTATQNLQRKRKKQNAREVAFVRSLFVVFILMCFSFIPYGLSVIISSRVTVPPEYVILGLLLLFTNNAVNWIIYGLMNPSFRKAYLNCGYRLLKRCCGPRGEQSEGHPSSSQSGLMVSSLQRVKAQGSHEVLSSSLAPSGLQSSG